jgi:hypothetical protein
VAYIVPKPAQTLKYFFIGYGDCLLAWQDHVVCRCGPRMAGKLRPETFSNQPLDPVSLHRPAIHFSRHRHTQTRFSPAIGLGQDFETTVGGNTGPFKYFAKGPLLGKAILVWQTHFWFAAWLNRAKHVNPEP